MQLKVSYILSVFILISCSLQAQLGIRGGVNSAVELHSFKNENISSMLQSDNLTGLNIGLVYQLNPKRSGFGLETGALFSQKGGTFVFDKNNVKESVIKGYHELNYLEVPFNLRLKINFGKVISVFGSSGVYGAYALEGKTVFENDLGDILHVETYDDLLDRIDFGYSYGFGVELQRKLQLTANWNNGLQKVDANKKLLEVIESESGIPTANLKAKKINNTFSISLTYLLW